MHELLAPAGSLESAMAAINSGADALYLGFPEFSARHSAGMDNQTFLKVLETARLFGVKVYVALNTFVKDNELDSFFKDAVYSWNSGADALILQDVWLGARLHERYPQIELHLSTQAGVCNIYGARLAKRMGFSRVILARETPVEDIAKIAKEIETECFIQGALCTCFSGQCYFSSFAGGCSGNRGMCKQPCRQIYTLGVKDRMEPAYRLSLADLSLGEDVKKLLDLGVASLKIEGRLRRPEYVAASVNYYRAILDGKVPDSPHSRDEMEGLLSDLKRTYNRGDYTKGLAFGQPGDLISSSVQGNIGERIGTVGLKSVRGVKRCFVDTPQALKKGDGFKILRAGKEVGGGAYGGATRNGRGCIISTSSRIQAGDDVHITTDSAANARLLSARRLADIQISAEFMAGRPAKAFINGEAYESADILEPAISSPLSVEDIKEAFLKTDTMPFNVSFGEIRLDESGVFMPKSILNEFRRTAYASYYATRTELHREQLPYMEAMPSREPYMAARDSAKTAVICRDTEDYANIAADIIILKPADYANVRTAPMAQMPAGKELFLYLPPYMNGRDLELVLPAAKQVGAVFAEGTYGLELAKEYGLKVFAGPGFNVTNRISADALAGTAEVQYICISKELTNGEAAGIAGGKCFCLTAGNLKLMDIVYCPLEKQCSTCTRSGFYGLTDEDDRTYRLVRYVATECRFELYNYRDLAAPFGPCGRLYDFTYGGAAQEMEKLSAGMSALDLYRRTDTTDGHSVRPAK